MEQFFSKILDSIKTKATTVAINVSSSSVLEVMEVDNAGMITNYASAPIQYNNLTKELENSNDFISAVKRCFSELGINLSSRAYVSIPTFVIDTQVLPNLEDNEGIKTMLISSVEKNYVFRKYDPTISFYKLPEEEADAGQMKLVYAALRADEYEKMKSALETLGIKVISIDSSYSALINGVISTQKVNPNVLEGNQPWNIINITSNSFIIFSMKGKNLISIYEEPLAVKSFSSDEVYQVITNSLDIELPNHPCSQVVIVSQSDEVSAEYLSTQINIDCLKTFIEDNKYRKQLVELGLNITQSHKTKVTLEAVGTAYWPFNTDGFKLNFLDAPISIDKANDEPIFITIGNQEIEITADWMKKALIIVAVILSVFLGLVYAGEATWYNGLNKQQEELSSKIKQLETELDAKPKSEGISESEFLQISYQDNDNYKRSYTSIAQAIPDMLWIEELEMSDKSNIYLHGRSYKMDDILNYYDSLKDFGKFGNLKINTLKISNTPISDLLLNKNSTMKEETTYEFIFGEKVYKEAVATPNPADNTNGAGNPTQEQSQDSNNIPAPPTADNVVPLPPAPTDIPKQDRT